MSDWKDQLGKLQQKVRDNEIVLDSNVEVFFMWGGIEVSQVFYINPFTLHPIGCSIKTTLVTRCHYRVLDSDNNLVDWWEDSII